MRGATLGRGQVWKPEVERIRKQSQERCLTKAEGRAAGSGAKWAGSGGRWSGGGGGPAACAAWHAAPCPRPPTWKATEPQFSGKEKQMSGIKSEQKN